MTDSTGSGKLDVALHGTATRTIFAGDDGKRFLDWFEALEVGCAIQG